jgi:hypothetical protein
MVPYRFPLFSANIHGSSLCWLENTKNSTHARNTNAIIHVGRNQKA